jgi:hypothetical protein
LNATTAGEGRDDKAPFRRHQFGASSADRLPRQGVLLRQLRACSRGRQLLQPRPEVQAPTVRSSSHGGPAPPTSRSGGTTGNTRSSIPQSSGRPLPGETTTRGDQAGNRGHRERHCDQAAI